MPFKQRLASIRKSKGLVALISVIAAPFLILATGTAIDSGRAFLVKAKLFAAVDAAGIAAARAVAEGEDAARDAAIKFFNANLPSDYHTAQLQVQQSHSAMMRLVTFPLICPYLLRSVRRSWVCLVTVL